MHDTEIFPILAVPDLLKFQTLSYNPHMKPSLSVLVLMPIAHKIRLCFESDIIKRGENLRVWASSPKPTQRSLQSMTALKAGCRISTNFWPISRVERWWMLLSVVGYKSSSCVLIFDIYFCK